MKPVVWVPLDLVEMPCFEVAGVSLVFIPLVCGANNAGLYAVVIPAQTKPALPE